MNRRRTPTLLITLLLLTLLFSACNQPTDLSTPTPLPSNLPTSTLPSSNLPTPTSPSSTLPASDVTISEVMAGAQGNNNFEFIELYNAGNQPLDLQGWSLVYRLSTSEQDLPLYRWTERTLIPPHGHWLLVRAGVEVGVPADGEFEQALNTFGGGLALRNSKRAVIDALAWGKAPAIFTEGTAAPALQNGTSLERAPGGEEGNAADSGNNAADFRLNPSPAPQNVGHPPTPPFPAGLSISLAAPQTVEPGAQFEYRLTVTNESERNLRGVSVEFPLPADLPILGELPAGVSIAEGLLSWQVGELAAGATSELTLPVEVPWLYFTATAHSYFARAEDWQGVAFGAPIYTRVEGGVIPIGKARAMRNAELTIEGIATMYTGGYFAGSGNTKFYLADATGGLQVQVFGGQGVVDVPLGSRVRVRGKIDVYRGAMEIVPRFVPDDVQILAPPNPNSLWAPTEVAIQQAINDFETLPGRLVQVTGTATRIEEFTYSYEIDLADEQGYTLTLYVDKQTNISIERLRAGRLYRVVGILEVRDGIMFLYPRIQEDLTEVFPPILMIEADLPNTVPAGEVFTVTLTAINHTPDTLTEVVITVGRPQGAARVESVLDGGVSTNGAIRWRVTQLPPLGGSVRVRYQLHTLKGEGQITVSDYAAVAAEWTEPARGAAVFTFIGDHIPIWAIQGSGFSSPYVLENLTVEGIVTGLFPDLDGFWIQETAADADPLTSEGLFVYSGNLDLDLQPGDAVQVHGQLREPSQQTTLYLSRLEDVQILSRENPFPAAVELDPPQEAAASRAYYESLEGMLVQVSGEAVAVSPTSKYGETVLVLSKHNVKRLWQGEENGFAIMVDDDSSAVHTDRSTLNFAVKTGDVVSNLLGPLAFTYGRYKIEPLTLPTIQPSPVQPASLLPAAGNEFSLMSWNVENLFDVLDPHPADPPRPRLAEYQLHLTKVANTIVAAGAPTVVGLQEIENLGVIEDLAAHELLAAYAYRPLLIEGHDSRYIDVGYLIRGDRAQIREVEQYDATEGLTSRPPLLVKIEMQSETCAITLFVINNHFTSMSGGELATEPRRIAQAAWNITILDEIRALDSQAYVAVIGDLNSYYNSPPIATLRQAGLQHVFDVLPPEERYTYIYQGESQTLDHILVTEGLMSLLRRVDVLHLDADFPPPIPGDPSPEHKSDHDAVVAVFGCH